MESVLQQIIDGFQEASRLDLINMILGVVGVVLMIRRTLWAFPVGLVAVSVQGILLYRETFYADTLLQVFFFGTLAWGWYHWVHDKGEAKELPITRLSLRGWLWLLGIAGTATVLWALGAKAWTDSVMPWRDAFIAAFGAAGQVIQARKQIENWLLWTVVNTVAVLAYWHAGLVFTSFLCVVYLGLAIHGWVAWTRAMKNQPAPDVFS